MRRGEKAMTTQQARDFLASQKVGRLGLCHDDRPYVVPVHYVLVDDHIYLHSALEGKKIQLLTCNPQVCFEVDEFCGFETAEEPCSFGTFFRSVIVCGEAQLVCAPQEKCRALSRLVAHCTGRQEFTLPEYSVERTAVIRIDIHSLSGKHHVPQ